MFENNQLTKEQAIILHDSGLWKEWDERKIAEFQLSQRFLCVPFDIFHGAIEDALGRPVFTHEFGLNYQGLYDELFNGKEPPTIEEIVNLIPEEKRVIILTPEAL